MKEKVIYILLNGLFLLVSTLSLTLGAAIVYRIVTPQSATGWDALADFLGFLMIAAILSLVFSIYLLKKLDMTRKNKLSIIGLLLLSLVFIIIYFFG